MFEDCWPWPVSSGSSLQKLVRGPSKAAVRSLPQAPPVQVAVSFHSRPRRPTPAAWQEAGRSHAVVSVQMARTATPSANPWEAPFSDKPWVGRLRSCPLQLQESLATGLTAEGTPNLKEKLDKRQKGVGADLLRRPWSPTRSQITSIGRRSRGRPPAPQSSRTG